MALVDELIAEEDEEIQEHRTRQDVCIDCVFDKFLEYGESMGRHEGAVPIDFISVAIYMLEDLDPTVVHRLLSLFQLAHAKQISQENFNSLKCKIIEDACMAFDAVSGNIPLH